MRRIEAKTIPFWRKNSMTENVEKNLTKEVQLVIEDKEKWYKEKSDKNIELLNNCLELYNSTIFAKALMLNDLKDSKLEELHKTAKNIHSKLEILNSKAEIYKDAIRLSMNLVATHLGNYWVGYNPYFGNTLYGLDEVNEFFNSLLKPNRYTPKPDVNRPFENLLDANPYAFLQKECKAAEEKIVNIENESAKWESLYRAEQEIERNKKFNDLCKKTEDIHARIYEGSLIKSFEAKNKQIATLKIKWYWLFFGVIVVLIGLSIRELILNDGSVINWNELINKVSLVLPLIWLAWFAAKRLNVLSKLETDYQFKEATAKTFESYKNEIEALKDDELKKQLLSTVIRNFGDNPVRLFDPKDDKGHTTEELLELAKKLKDLTK